MTKRAGWFPSAVPRGIAAQMLWALMGGAAGVLAFAPFHIWPLALLSLWLLFAAWHRATTAWRAFGCGFAWGLGLFLGGISWIYVSLHVYGNMPALLAGLATLLFCAYLALYPALAGGLYRLFASRPGVSPPVALLAVMPACFVAFEYLRGWVLSGCPWLTMGYAQTPGGALAAPLAGYAAIFGVYGISWLTAVTAGLVLWWVDAERVKLLARPARFTLVFLLLLVWGAGPLLMQMPWTLPAGQLLPVALVQGNIEQQLKWRDDQRAPTLASYLQLVSATRAKLIVLPETALPDFLDRIPSGFLDSLSEHARRQGGDVLVGAPIAERPAASGMQYHLSNSAVSLGTSPSQRYDKQHLVAFGEFVPPLFAWVYRFLQIPLADFNPRTDESRPMRIAGHAIAINICYEDAFGREIAAQLPDAELLVNISNMAWFGRSLAADQHAQMSQMRALETGRWMLRATNTGATAAINEKGVIVQALPAFTRGVLEVDVQPLTGATPYSRWRDAPILLIVAAGLLLPWVFRRRTSSP